MATTGPLPPPFAVGLLCFLCLINSSLTYSLKNCSIIYQEIPSAEIALDCAGRKLVTIPDDLPRHAVTLQLGENLLEKIIKGSFCDMSKLRFLNVTSNKVAHVEDGSFTDLVSLKTLDMSNNNLTSLTRDMFQGLSNLTELDLSGNNVQFIHSSALQPLISLQTLDLNDNGLQQVASIQPILQLPQIQTLSLTCNNFSSFETKDLPLNLSSSLKVLGVSSLKLETFSITTPIFPYLQKLELSVCGRSSELQWDIPDKALLRNITHLYLTHPVLSFEDFQTVIQSFESLSHLRLGDLDFERGLLTTICQIQTLRKLDLFYDDLTSLSTEACSQLTEIDLTLNTISELPKGTFQSMKHLRSLNVSLNSLTTIPYDVRSMDSLEVLNLNANLISELTCEDFEQTTHLAELSLNNNKIVKLERCVFENLSNLKLLDVSNNDLQTFGDTFLTSLQKLEVLDMSRNVLTIVRICDFQDALKQLDVKTLFFGRENSSSELNNLESLAIQFIMCHDDNASESLRSTSQDDFIHLKSMKSFTVSCSNADEGFNSFKAKASSFWPLTYLLRAMEHLDTFRGVHVHASHEDTFQFNSQLKSLTLAKTDLSDLNSKFFLSVPNLQILDLSDNNIESLEFLVQAELYALRYLKLSDNEINVINETVFTSLPSLTYLDLSNNPFSCECSNSGFIQWVKDNKQTQVVNAHQYKCSFPVDKRGTFLLDFDFHPCLDDGGFFLFISSSCLVVLTLLTSFIYHFLKWKLVYTYHLFLAFLYDSWKGKKGDPHQFDAFVSYNVHDEDWVYREMLPALEGEQGWRLCLHHRDFQPGKPIIENITDAIYGSRKTICVVSRHYLQSEWCSREIQMASFRLFDEQKDVLILLFLEEIPPHHLSPHYRMRKLVKKRTYLSWPQAAQHPGVFWQNVQRALQTGDKVTENTDLLTGASA
uniref:TIR domain-containing protein n=1 Tax=Iconisemion striatum TaxID=60296 RepID=A0A1A7XAD6_9TELE